MDMVTVPEDRVVERRLASLEAENRHLRARLMEAAEQAEAERGRTRRTARGARTERRDDRVGGRVQPGTGLEELNAQLRASEEFNRGILGTTTDCVTVLDLDGRIISVSENGPAVFGVANFAGLMGLFWIDFWRASETCDEIGRALEAARAGRPCRFQCPLASSGGAATWWDIAVTPINGVDGRPERILAVSRDISELKWNEARQTLLMQEMAHRIKNTLAMVQAIAAQTLRNAVSLEAAGESLSARLLALSQAHDVLMQGSWASASLAGIVAGAVTLHGDGEPDRFRVQGPDLTLAPRPAMTLALMLHELGTNAAKYGALSTARGHVAIGWAVAEAEGGSRLRFRWEEIGGPPVAPPTRAGFGTRLIERSLANSFGGTVRLEFPAPGVVPTLDAALDTVDAG